MQRKEQTSALCGCIALEGICSRGTVGGHVTFKTIIVVNCDCRCQFGTLYSLVTGRVATPNTVYCFTLRSKGSSYKMLLILYVTNA